MKIYEFWGLKRSGNHAILEWLIKNLIDSTKEKHYINDDPHDFYWDQLLFVNCYHNAEYKKQILKTGLKLKPQLFVITYEDLPTSYSIFTKTKTIKSVILRSLPNLVASRLKYTHEKIKTNNEFFELWQEHANFKQNKIFYDRWLVDVAYRNSISEFFGVENKSMIDHIPTAGGGSSFTGTELDTTENLLTRYRQIQLPADLKEKIRYYGQRNPEYSNYQDL